MRAICQGAKGGDKWYIQVLDHHRDGILNGVVTQQHLWTTFALTYDEWGRRRYRLFGKALSKR